MDGPTQDAYAALLSNDLHWISVVVWEECEQQKESERDPHRIIEIVGAIASCEERRTRLDTASLGDIHAFQRLKEDLHRTQILSEVLYDRLELYWEIAKRFNARVGRRAIMTSRELIEAELRRRGQLAEDETLE